MSATSDANGAGIRNGRRRLLLSLVLAAFATAGASFAGWWFVSGRYYESTDDAYVVGNLVQVTPQLAGTVLAIHADDTDFVNAGQTLVELDKADSRVSLDQAEAQLAKTVRSVRNLIATDAQLQASVEQRRAELDRAREDLARRIKLESDVPGAVAGEEIQHARDAVAAANAALEAASRQLDAQRTLTDHTTVESHPDVREAAAKVREAYLAYSRTALPAPVSGFIARRSVQVGQRVSPGAPLMTVVPLDQVWVDANFKESQLPNLRAGQPVKLVADAYGRSVSYHGKLAGFGAGTGSAFSLLPAQNATGNWIKVVQRVPVRIALDPAELREHPLQIGLSMEVEVDTHERGGERLPKIARSALSYETRAFSPAADLADRRVAEIIAANSGGPLSSLARGGAGFTPAGAQRARSRPRPPLL
ncbi:MAG TPA: efflux RND transporter periplasmic adaptor subunit [Burkholderiales bacterium]|nr:efflux RND transporter periplasmic adaptor subunit [Burkholderiales bacterium]